MRKNESYMTKTKAKKRSSEVVLQDPMAEAGRKLFSKQISRMKRHEVGSRSGEDIESVHQMRVAIRRMRSLFKLIGSHYQPKTVAKYGKGLRRIARALGNIRDLDVLIVDLQDYQSALPADSHATLDLVVAILEARRDKYRCRLNDLFDSRSYARFVRQIERLCRKPGRGAKAIARPEQPHQVRHVLPLLLHERLAKVRAYDSVLPAKDDTVLHALRVEFKQLRYALEFFNPLLGKSADAFLVEVKAMQELLGRINDIAVFDAYMRQLGNLSPEQVDLIQGYLADRDDELSTLRESFYEKWQCFNSRARHRQFADSMLVLR